MATAKAFIGNGKTTQYDGVRVTLRMEDAQKFVRSTESGDWLSFIVSPKRQTDGKGRTHNVFVLVDQPDTDPMNNVMADPMELAEPHGPVPEGTTVTIDGRKLKRISKRKAAQMRAAA